jgi:hypothetical protein
MPISFRTYTQGYKAGQSDSRRGLPPLNFTARDYVVSRNYINGYRDGYGGTAPAAAEGAPRALHAGV